MTDPLDQLLTLCMRRVGIARQQLAEAERSLAQLQSARSEAQSDLAACGIAARSSQQREIDDISRTPADLRAMGTLFLISDTFEYDSDRLRKRIAAMARDIEAARQTVEDRRSDLARLSRRESKVEAAVAATKAGRRGIEMLMDERRTAEAP